MIASNGFALARGHIVNLHPVQAVSKCRAQRGPATATPSEDSVKSTIKFKYVAERGGLPQTAKKPNQINDVSFGFGLRLYQAVVPRSRLITYVKQLSALGRTSASAPLARASRAAAAAVPRLGRTEPHGRRQADGLIDEELAKPPPLNLRQFAIRANASSGRTPTDPRQASV